MKWLFLLIFLIPTVASSKILEQKVIGHAYDDQGVLRYTEHHLVTYEDKRLLRLKTEYHNLKNETFGSLNSDFSKSVELPDYTFKDDRFERSTKSEFLQETRQVKVFGKANKESKQKETTLDLKQKQMITGQGLHGYVLTNIERLKDLKEPFEFYFVIPMLQDYYSFRMRVLKKDAVKALVTFRVEIDNWFLRLFAPHIDATYDYKKPRIMQYQGMSNLLDETQDSYDVTIKYSYP